MNTLKWLGVVASLALALAVIRLVLGESLIGFAFYFILVTGVVHYLLGRGNWLRVALGGIAATAAYAVFLRLFPN